MAVLASLLTLRGPKTKMDRSSEMPFKSEKQKRYLYVNEPAIAKKFQKEEGKIKGKRKTKKKK
jgi:hypothetical protein